LNRTSAAKVSGQHQAEAQAYVQNARILAESTSAHLEGEQNLSRVIELLEKAVALDPGFSEAHAELALAYSLRVHSCLTNDLLNFRNRFCHRW
jgi:hypothetical protein